MMLNDRIQNVNALQYVLRKAEEYLTTLAPETPYSKFEHRFQEIGLERGWGDNAERVLGMIQLLLDLLEAPDPCTLETFLGKIPMVFNVVIMSPHGYFAQDNVLGYSDTGGQVVYMLDQVQALESEMLNRIKHQGLDITPHPSYPHCKPCLGTTCGQRLEKVYGSEHADILRVPFRNEKRIVRKWISRFEVWPYLETYTEDVAHELSKELQGKPDLIIGNYSDGNIVASLSVAEEFKTEPEKVGSEENGVAISLEGFPICSDGGLKEGSEIQEKVECNLGDETGSIGSCTKNNKANPSRFQLEQDVHRLQQQLQEEMELPAILEMAVEKNAMKLSSSSRLPHQISLSSRCSKHSVSEVGDACEDISCQELQDQPLESIDKCKESVIENGEDAVVLCHDKKMSCQPVEFRKLPKGMPTKGLWDHPNQLLEEMVKCLKNIFISLTDSALPSKSSASESHCSPQSPRGHLSNLSWWSSSERSMRSSWVQSPQVDVKSNSEVLASENACDPYRVRGKLSWVDIGNYGLATEVSWMSVGKKQLEYAAGALRSFSSAGLPTLLVQPTTIGPCASALSQARALTPSPSEPVLPTEPILTTAPVSQAEPVPEPPQISAPSQPAYLAYGVPRSDLKLFSLMQK
ncbi:isoform 2 of rho gtpase-activating protein 7, partial [Fagus crenata]